MNEKKKEKGLYILYIYLFFYFTGKFINLNIDYT
jgi:hypothetical protein